MTVKKKVVKKKKVTEKKAPVTWEGKHPGGRPTKYEAKYVEELIEFFDIEPYREVEVTHITKKGDKIVTTEERANDIPFFSHFAREIGVCVDTLNEWCKKHKEFSEAYKAVKAIQKEILITNGLKGFYNSGFACFTAKNITDMRDQKDVNLGGQEDNPLEVNVKGMSVSELYEFLQEKINEDGR